jgi:hypothetical protein
MTTAEPLDVAGNPTSLGAGHGAALREAIRFNCERFLRASEGVFGIPYERIRAHLDAFDRFVPDEYRDEMQAVAQAAGVSYEDILALNTFLDTDAIVESQVSHCINLVAYGAATADGRLIHGRNLDFPTAGTIEKTAAVLVVRPDRGNAFLSVGLAAFVGTPTGMNEHGLTVTEITSRTPHVRAEGVPLMILLRMVLQYASSIAEASEIIRSTPRTAGFNITLTDWRGPEAVCVEFDCENVGIRRARRSLLVVSENRLTPALSRGQRLSPSGVARHIRAHDLADEHYGRITPEVMREILRDRWDPVYRRVGKSHNCLCSNDTVQSVVFLPEERHAWVSNRSIPAPDGESIEYRIPAKVPASADEAAR